MAKVEKPSAPSEYFELKIPRNPIKSGGPNLVMVLLLVILSFLLGMLFSKVQYLEKEKKAGTETTTAQQQAPQQPPQPSATIEQIKALFTNDNIYFGDKNSKTLFVEVADPSCPWCHVAAGQNPEIAKQVGRQLTTDGGTYNAPVPEMKKLVDEGKAALVWIYTSGHGNGEMGTKALYCAHEKGKFWPVHDKLMTNDGYNLLNNTVRNDKANAQTLADFLTDVFDPSSMKACLDSGKYDKEIVEDSGLAAGIGISGTPGFYINTTSFSGAYSWDEMKSAVNQ